MADPYLIPGTDILRNKLGILDPDHLDRQIDDLTIVEASYLFNEGPPVRPSLAGWQAVHKAMFGEVFDWAGDFRTIHIRKLDENSDPSGYFTAPERIEPDGRKAVRHLEATLRRAKTDDLARIADNLADVYAQLNLLHPFREGNGRSQKVFFSAVCKPLRNRTRLVRNPGRRTQYGSQPCDEWRSFSHEETFPDDHEEGRSPIAQPATRNLITLFPVASSSGLNIEKAKTPPLPAGFLLSQLGPIYPATPAHPQPGAALQQCSHGQSTSPTTPANR